MHTMYCICMCVCSSPVFSMYIHISIAKTCIPICPTYELKVLKLLLNSEAAESDPSLQPCPTGCPSYVYNIMIACW